MITAELIYKQAPRSEFSRMVSEKCWLADIGDWEELTYNFLKNNFTLSDLIWILRCSSRKIDNKYIDQLIKIIKDGTTDRLKGRPSFISKLYLAHELFFFEEKQCLSADKENSIRAHVKLIYESIAAG